MPVEPVFILGSCRVWSSSYRNNWSSTNSTIQSHYSDEILQYIDWLINKEELSDTERRCFRDEIDNNKWKILRNNFSKCQIVLVEISSIKTLKINNLFHNLLIDNTHVKSDTIESFHNKILNILDILNNLNKKCIFFSHINTYSVRNMGFVKNRTIIQEQFKIALKKKQFIFVDPSNIVAKYGQERCLMLNDNKESLDEYDINHYTLFMHNEIAKCIKRHMIN